MREAYSTDIAPEVAKRWAEKVGDGSSVQTKKDPSGNFRASVARDLFSKLPLDEQAGYGERAKTEASAAREAYDTALKSAPSRAPKDRQKYVYFGTPTREYIYSTKKQMHRSNWDLRSSNSSRNSRTYGSPLFADSGWAYPEVWRGAQNNLVSYRSSPYLDDKLTNHSITYGRNKTGAGAHFPQWGKERFNGVLDLMKEYLGTAFSACFAAEKDPR